MLEDISERVAALNLALTINYLQVQCGVFLYEFIAHKLDLSILTLAD